MSGSTLTYPCAAVNCIEVSAGDEGYCLGSGEMTAPDEALTVSHLCADAVPDAPIYVVPESDSAANLDPAAIDTAAWFHTY